VGIKLSCLSCGHSLDVGDAYDNYQGPVRCWVCQALMNVTLEDGMLRGMQPAPPAVAGAQRAAADPTSRQES
jgi:hypothetical protein